MKPCGKFFGKVLGLQQSNLLNWNPTTSVYLGITKIIFLCILQNSHYMESLHIIDEFCSHGLHIYA